MRYHYDDAEKIRDYVNRQIFPVRIYDVAEHLGVNHATARNTALRQIALGAWRRTDDGRVMGANCNLPPDWTEDVDNHMEPRLLETCMGERDLIDVWRNGAWLTTSDIQALTGASSYRIRGAFDRGTLPYRMILGNRRAKYDDVLTWANE